MDLFDMLPYSRETILIDPIVRDKIFNVILKLLECAIDAIEAFFDNHFYHFDAHVGDTACQIRAYEISLIAKSSPRNLIHLDFEKIKSSIHNFNACKKSVFEKKRLDTFINENKLLINLLPLTVYLVKLKLLSDYKYFDSYGDANIDYEQLKNSFGVSKHLARKLIHEYQVSVSLSTVNFLRGVNKEIKFVDEESFEMLVKRDEDSRWVFPCYLGMKILYSFLSYESFPTHFLICRCHTSDGETLARLAYGSEQKSNICIVIYGISKGFHDNREASCVLKRNDIKNIVYWNMASHPQYVGLKNNDLAENPYVQVAINYPKNDWIQQYKRDRVYAFEKGYSKYNAGTFWIRHFFACDKSDLVLPKGIMKSREDMANTV